jgi:hypothetical protein
VLEFFLQKNGHWNLIKQGNSKTIVDNKILYIISKKNYNLIYNKMLIVKLWNIWFKKIMLAIQNFVSFINHVLEFLLKKKVIEILLNKEILVFFC